MLLWLSPVIIINTYFSASLSEKACGRNEIWTSGGNSSVSKSPGSLKRELLMIWSLLSSYLCGTVISQLLEIYRKLLKLYNTFWIGFRFWGMKYFKYQKLLGNNNFGKTLSNLFKGSNIPKSIKNEIRPINVPFFFPHPPKISFYLKITAKKVPGILIFIS